MGGSIRTPGFLPSLPLRLADFCLALPFPTTGAGGTGRVEEGVILACASSQKVNTSAGADAFKGTWRCACPPPQAGPWGPSLQQYPAVGTAPACLATGSAARGGVWQQGRVL